MGETSSNFAILKSVKSKEEKWISNIERKICCLNKKDRWKKTSEYSLKGIQLDCKGGDFKKL